MDYREAMSDQKRREIVARDLGALHRLLDRVQPGWYASMLAHESDEGNERGAVGLPLRAAMRTVGDAARWGLRPPDILTIDIGITQTLEPAEERAELFRRVSSQIDFGSFEPDDLIVSGDRIKDAGRSEDSPEARAGRMLRHAAELMKAAGELLDVAAAELEGEEP